MIPKIQFFLTINSKYIEKHKSEKMDRMTGEKRRSCITGIYLFIRVLHFLKLGSKCSKVQKRKKNQAVLPEPDEEEEDWRTGAGGTVATFIRANVKSISIPLYLESEICQHLGDKVNEVFTNRR